jgi:hypothetical protein
VSVQLIFHRPPRRGERSRAQLNRVDVNVLGPFKGTRPPGGSWFPDSRAEPRNPKDFPAASLPPPSCAMAEKSPAAEVEASLLAHLNSASEVLDSRSYVSSLGVSHAELESVIKSLSAFRIVESTVRSASSPSISRNQWFIPDPEA